MRARRPVMLLLADAAAGAACVRIPSLAKTHPRSHADLIALAPRCAHPSSTEYSLCDDAARILELAPEAATHAFVSSWQTHVFDALPDTRYGGVTQDPLGDAELRKVVASAIEDLAAIERPCLRHVYETHPGVYADRMTKALDAVVFRSPQSLKLFQTEDEAAKLAAEVATPTPAPTPTVEDL